MEYWSDGSAGGESPLVQTYSGRAGLLDRYLPPVFRPSFLAKVIVFLGRQARNQGAIIPGS